MWPLLFLSVISLAIIAERIVFFVRHRYRVGGSLEDLRVAQANPQMLDVETNPMLSMGQVFLTSAGEGEEHCPPMQRSEQMH